MRQILGLTEFNFTNPCGKNKSGCEASMKQTIEDIRSLLKDGTFKDEQHVRFSLVGRRCQALGWNIWSPEEFYTEFPVTNIQICNDGLEAKHCCDSAKSAWINKENLVLFDHRKKQNKVI